MFDLDFQGHTIKIEFFYYHCWILRTPGNMPTHIVYYNLTSNPNITRIIIIVIAWGPLDPRCAKCALDAFLCVFLLNPNKYIFPKAYKHVGGWKFEELQKFEIISPNRLLRYVW